MSKMGNYLLSIQEIVDPMVYQGYGDKVIIDQVKTYVPEASVRDIEGVISRARFDYGCFDSYA